MSKLNKILVIVITLATLHLIPPTESQAQIVASVKTCSVSDYAGIDTEQVYTRILPFALWLQTDSTYATNSPSDLISIDLTLISSTLPNVAKIGLVLGNSNFVDLDLDTCLLDQSSFSEIGGVEQNYSSGVINFSIAPGVVHFTGPNQKFAIGIYIKVVSQTAYEQEYEFQLDGISFQGEAASVSPALPLVSSVIRVVDMTPPPPVENVQVMYGQQAAMLIWDRPFTSSIYESVAGIRIWRVKSASDIAISNFSVPDIGKHPNAVMVYDSNYGPNDNTVDGFIDSNVVANVFYYYNIATYDGNVGAIPFMNQPVYAGSPDFGVADSLKPWINTGFYYNSTVIKPAKLEASFNLSVIPDPEGVTIVEGPLGLKIIWDKPNVLDALTGRWQVYRRFAGAKDSIPLGGTILRGNTREYFDNTVSEGTGYDYIVKAQSFEGNLESTGVKIRGYFNPLKFDGDVAIYPTVVNISEGDYLNIAFRLNGGGNVKAEIFSVSGEKIITLADGIVNSGDHYLRWEGRNSSNNLVSSGTYYINFKSPLSEAQRRVQLIISRSNLSESTCGSGMLVFMLLIFMYSLYKRSKISFSFIGNGLMKRRIMYTMLIPFIFIHCYNQLSTDLATFTENPFNGQQWVENFATGDWLDLDPSVSTANFISTNSYLAQGPGIVGTKLITIDTSFYKYDQIKVVFKGTAHLRIYDRVLTSDPLEMLNIVSGTWIQLGSSPIIVSAMSIVITIELETGATIERFILERKPITNIPINTFFAQPTPFNPYEEVIKFRFAIFERSRVNLSIYSLDGALVRKIIDNEPRDEGNQGSNAFGDDYWQGVDQQNRSVVNGSYTAELEISSLTGADRRNLTTVFSVIAD